MTVTELFRFNLSGPTFYDPVRHQPVLRVVLGSDPEFWEVHVQPNPHDQHQVTVQYFRPVNDALVLQTLLAAQIPVDVEAP